MTMSDLNQTASEVLSAYRSAGLRIVTAESCTGGLIAGTLTEIAGSSDVVERGFVTYSNEAKEDLLRVPHAMLEEHGAVSSEVARAMAEGALQNSRADVAISVTGIAGPGGGSAGKPVGLVYFGLCRRGESARFERRVFEGTRKDVRAQSVGHALQMLLSALAPRLSE